MVRSFLGTAEDDPQYSSTILDPILQAAYFSLLEDVKASNPGYLGTTTTLQAASATSHTYALAAQSPAITTFAGWLDVRYTDEDGSPLQEVRFDELSGMPGECFALVGQDEALTLITSTESTAGNALWFRYIAWPAEWTSDNDTPTKLPSRFHDVIALEALFAFGLGGEQRLPPELYDRWQDRRGQLIDSVTRRGIQPVVQRLRKDSF